MTSLIGELGEFAIIDLIINRLCKASDLTVGPGDDAAVLQLSDAQIVVSTDILIENRHFRRDWSSASNIGQKAAAANLADIAAMGARPISLLLALGLPSDVEVRWVLNLIDGFQREASSVGASVAGGDLSRSESVVVAATSLGSLHGRPPVKRNGARAGDKVVIVGRLGWAAAGLALLYKERTSPVELLEAHRVPQPPYAAGQDLSAAGATAMCDVSDGLLQDLGHIASASGVRINLRLDTFAVDPILAVAAESLNVDPLLWILTGGDDHALVATIPHSSELPAGCIEVGTVDEGLGVFVDGKEFQGVGGHDHFARK